LVSLHL